MRIEQDTKLKDLDGVEHKYDTVQYPALEGIRLAQDILAVAAEPIGNAIAAFASSGSVPELSVSSLLDDDGMDFSGIGVSVATLAQNLDTELLLRIFSGTTRDGYDLGSRPLFDSAYTGNLGEMFSALAWILKVNFEHIFDAIKPSGKPGKPSPG